jgi:hypothetical protein
MSVPVYVFACLVTLAFAVLGDRLGHRGYRGYINLSVIPILTLLFGTLTFLAHQNLGPFWGQLL